MRYLLIIIVLSALCLTAYTQQQFDLQKLIDKAKNGETIILKAGVYEASAFPYLDELCGNCLEHKTKVWGTGGFIIKNKTIHIKGIHRDSVIIKTNAGYGIIFDNSQHSSISNVTIGGGKRDTSGDATNGGIVLKYSKVRIFDCKISNDTVRKSKTPIVGICGIVLRENSEAIIRSNLISFNTWDGIALYRGANAYIMDNVIEYGRGVGIGITWDATATVLRNRVSNYWKGIGTFGTSHAVVKNNAVFDNLGWGLVISGNSHMLAENNVITRNGNCGVAPWADSTENATGVIVNNIITENGWRKEWVCPLVGYWLNASADKFIFKFNNVWNNSDGNYRMTEDLTGINGNVSIDPMFKGKFDFSLQSTSQLLFTGSTDITNPEGTRSHIGIDGGQTSR